MASKDKVPGWDRVGHKKPTLKQLQAYVIPKIAKNWSGVGIELYEDDDASRLEIIRSECPGDIMKACTEMFKYWRNTDVNASWTKLINALRSPGLRLNADALDIMKVVVKELAKDDNDAGSGQPDAPLVSAAVVNILDEKPDMLKLKQIVIPEVKAYWDNLAYSMKYEILQVEAIDRNGRDVGDRCSRLFQDWLETPNGCTPKTWKELIERIRSVSNLYAAAGRIKNKLISESKLSTKEKIPVVTNTGHSDNEEDKSAHAAHKTEVVNKRDDHGDYEGAPPDNRSAHAASKRKPSRQSPSRCLEDPCLCGMMYCAIFVGIVAVITVGILSSNNATINDIIASITPKYGNEAIAEESNDDDSSSQGAPSEDILSNGSNTTINDVIASSSSKYGNEAVAEESSDDVSGSKGAPAVDILNKKPEMADLNKIVVKKVMVQWEQLAEGFRYDNAIIANIKKQNRENSEECCREFLRDWLGTDNGIKAGPKTWSTLFDIIKEYTSIGRDIREDMIVQVKKLKG